MKNGRSAFILKKIVKKSLFGVWDLFEIFHGEVFYVCYGQILQKL